MIKLVIALLISLLSIGQVTMAQTATLPNEIKERRQKLINDLKNNLPKAETSNPNVSGSAPKSPLSTGRSKVEFVDTTVRSNNYYYPKVCDVKWNGAKNVLSMRCPNTAGFKKFEYWYGSGYSDGTTKDDSNGIFSADNEWHEQGIYIAPDESNYNWTNTYIIPLF